jgi:16S rRNA (cytosine1402-N4)-methyltransferase
MTAAAHIPVMLEEAIAALAPADGGRYVDATLGAGGYARGVLAAADCTLYAFDRDPAAIAAADAWAPAFGGRLVLINRPFAEMESALSEFDVRAVDGVVFDVGVSSMQLDDPTRGFSFLRDGPLSMRMDGGKPDAADVVNRAGIKELAAIFRVYGEERRARRIAQAIVEERANAPIATTGRLADIVTRASPARAEDRIHPATRIFQALRILVNDELGQLARALGAAERLLRPAGRLVAVTFHSLEDRIVKRFIAERGAAAPRPSRHAPSVAPAAPTFRPLGRPQTPSEAEIAGNPRARSAMLRAALRTEAPARAVDVERLAPPLPYSPLWSPP